MYYSPDLRLKPSAEFDGFSQALKEALLLVERGVPCFPCRADKRPATLHGFKDASRNRNDLEHIWRRYPGPLVGVPTGEASGFDVLDIDKQHHGDHWFLDNKSALLPTRAHRTRSGGIHLLFKHTEAFRCSAGKIAPGIDVRAIGGYVIWWPAAGLPVLSDMPVVAWPAWLRALLRSRPRPEFSAHYSSRSIRADALGALNRGRSRGRAEQNDLLGCMPRRRNGRLRITSGRSGSRGDRGGGDASGAPSSGGGTHGVEWRPNHRRDCQCVTWPPLT